MKKIFLILMLSLPIITYSQMISIKGGSTISKFNYPKGFINPIPTSLVSSTFGLIYSHNLNKFQITIEPTFNNKGYTKTSQSPLTNESTGEIITYYKLKQKSVFSYFEIPITFGWVPIKNKIILGLNIGIAPTYLISTKERTVSPSKYHFKSYNSDLLNSDYYRKLNMDIIASIKAGYNISPRTFITLNLRYGRNIFNVVDSKYEKVNYNYLSTFLEVGYKLKK